MVLFITDIQAHRMGIKKDANKRDNGLELYGSKDGRRDNMEGTMKSRGEQIGAEIVAERNKILISITFHKFFCSINSSDVAVLPEFLILILSLS